MQPPSPYAVAFAASPDRGRKQIRGGIILLAVASLLVAGAIAAWLETREAPWFFIPALAILALALAGAIVTIVKGARVASGGGATAVVDVTWFSVGTQVLSYSRLRSLLIRTSSGAVAKTSAGSYLAARSMSGNGVVDGFRHIIATGRDGSTTTLDLSNDFGWDEWLRLREVLADRARRAGVEVVIQGEPRAHDLPFGYRPPAAPPHRP